MYEVKIYLPFLWEIIKIEPVGTFLDLQGISMYIERHSSDRKTKKTRAKTEQRAINSQTEFACIALKLRIYSETNSIRVRFKYYL